MQTIDVQTPVRLCRGDRIVFNGARARVDDLRVVDGEIQAYLIFGDNGLAEGSWCVIHERFDGDETVSVLGSLLAFLLMLTGIATVVYALVGLIGWLAS